MIQVNAKGDACPIPVVKTRNAIKELAGSGVVETLVDNEIAVQNLSKMAVQKGYGLASEQLGEHEYKVTLTIGAPDEAETEPEAAPLPAVYKKSTVVAIGSNEMGVGNAELGQLLIKSFIYALGQQDELPAGLVFYNSGANLTCEGSASLEDLHSLLERGVQIVTCGTCLDFYDLKEQLRVGEVSNMYEIVEILTQADTVVRP